MAFFRNKEDLLRAVREETQQFDERWEQRRVAASLDEVADLEATMARPGFWDDPDKAKELSVRKSDIEKRVFPWRALRNELKDFPDLVELTFEETKDQKAAVESLEEDYNRLHEKFEELLMAEALMGEDDNRNAIVNIASGAGGTESQDWADMLLRMYTRWFDKSGYRTDLIDLQPGEEAGIKSATMIVHGENAFGKLKSENGVHRLVRISPFDSNKRRHTSFAAVHITPEIDDDVDVQIDEKDLRVDTYRSSGAGGQHVNKTDSAVRITHIPTGIVVQCQNERSQMKNRSTAMKMLKARLYEMEKDRIKQDIESRSGEKKDVAWGSQIRSYVFHPYKMVKDLRTGYETSDVEGVMDGDLDPFMNAYLKDLAGIWKKPAETLEKE
ncbi:MAG: peptide chain release factor 2 [Spirochaetia bacterium]|nr:peptide chain release factor 2 [Spirochaetia bacterium]